MSLALTMVAHCRRCTCLLRCVRIPTLVRRLFFHRALYSRRCVDDLQVRFRRFEDRLASVARGQLELSHTQERLAQSIRDTIAHVDSVSGAPIVGHD